MTYNQTADGPVTREDGTTVDETAPDLVTALELVEGAHVLACVTGSRQATYTTRQGAGTWTRGQDR